MSVINKTHTEKIKGKAHTHTHTQPIGCFDSRERHGEREITFIQLALIQSVDFCILISILLMGWGWAL